MKAVALSEERIDERITVNSTPADPGRNPGMALDLNWLQSLRVNRSSVERRAATLPSRRSVKKQWQAAWLLKAISCIDLTTLAGDDTPGRVRRLCAGIFLKLWASMK